MIEHMIAYDTEGFLPRGNAEIGGQWRKVVNNDMTILQLQAQSKTHRLGLGLSGCSGREMVQLGVSGRSEFMTRS